MRVGWFLREKHGNMTALTTTDEICTHSSPAPASRSENPEENGWSPCYRLLSLSLCPTQKQHVFFINITLNLTGNILCTQHSTWHRLPGTRSSKLSHYSWAHTLNVPENIRGERCRKQNLNHACCCCSSRPSFRHPSESLINACQLGPGQQMTYWK